MVTVNQIDFEAVGAEYGLSKTQAYKRYWNMKQTFQKEGKGSGAITKEGGHDTEGGENKAKKPAANGAGGKNKRKNATDEGSAKSKKRKVAEVEEEETGHADDSVAGVVKEESVE